jgi:hypothetical protein
MAQTAAIARGVIVVVAVNGPVLAAGRRSHGVARSAMAKPVTHLRATRRMAEKMISVTAT